MRSILLSLFIICATLSHAIPAERGWHKMCLRDGGEVLVQMMGDEFASWYQTADGQRYTMQEGGLVRLADKHFSEMMDARQQCHEAMAEVIDARRAVDVQSRLSSKVYAPAHAGYKGSHRGLVILVQFADLKFSSLGTAAEFQAMYNEEGYNHYNHIGSVHDYFHDQSYGQFDLQFDVMGPITMPEGFAYYGQNYAGLGVDSHVATMVTTACRAIDDEVDFKQYDWNNDGTVDQVFIVFAGYGAHVAGAASNRLYPMMWTLDNAYAMTHDGTGPIRLDGVTINTFAQASELASVYGSSLSGIGVACHEFSHCFGLPDIYDVNYSGTPSMGVWDLLDSGGDNGRNKRGETPAPYTAYERMECGWLEPIVLDHPQYVTHMPCLQDEPVAYVINTDNRNEYFMLENRQHKGWDSYTGNASAHGLLITHIDYDRNAWNTNQVNIVKSHPRITYVPADGRYGTESGQYSANDTELAGDPFPGTSRNTSFTDTSSPAARTLNVQSDGRYLLHKPLTDIADADGFVSFTYMGGVNFSVPTAYQAKDINADGFTARWSDVEGVETYDLLLNRMNISQVTENLESFLSAANGATDLSAELDAYMSVSGWTGSKVFTSSRGMLLGSSSANSGQLISPSFTVDGDVSVRINARVYNSSDSKTLTISLIDKYGEVVHAVSGTDSDKTTDLTMTTTPTDYEVLFEDVSGEVRLSIAPAKRAYIAGIDFDYGAVAETKTISGITTSEYTFTQLEPSVYTYQVRAVRGSELTKWSNKIRVEVVDPTGIEAIEADKTTMPNNTDVTGIQGTGRTVYNLAGQRVLPTYRGIVVVGGKKHLSE